MSGRTSTPSAVGRTQRSRPPAVLLVGREVVEHVIEGVGERLPRQAQRVQQAGDPRRALRRRDLGLDADPARGAKPVRDGFPVQQLREPGRGLHGMAERVAQVERDPTAARPAFALVGDDDFDLRPGTSLHELRDVAALDGRRFPPRDRVAVAFEQLEQPLVAERGHLDRLAERGPPLALGKRREQADIDDDRGRLVEGTDEVLAFGQVDRGLAPDRRVDLGDQGRGDVHDRDAAQVRRRQEPGGIPERASADGDDGLVALHA